MRPNTMNEVIDGKRYRTETATLLASDAYWDGHNHERNGRNTFLYRTPKGNYFLQHQTMWQGEHDTIAPISEEEAMAHFETLQDKEMDFAEAFPHYEVEEA